MKGYKVFGKDWVCRDFKYTCPGKFEMDEEPVLCVRGFHFCKDLQECFKYYGSNEVEHVAEVDAYGDIDEDGGNKCCTNKIKIVKEIPLDKVYKLYNSGSCNKGVYNTGNNNLGDYNTGDRNYGSYNTGDRNHGYGNSGSSNIGYSNTGGHNYGNGNVGNGNHGSNNVGFDNYGNSNIGMCNIGYSNFGEYNNGDYNFGAFNTDGCKIYLFNKPTNWTMYDWVSSCESSIMELMPRRILNWINQEDSEPHLEVVDKSKLVADRQEWWNELPDVNKQKILNLPNFDPDIFKECTGIEVRKNGKDN